MLKHVVVGIAVLTVSILISPYFVPIFMGAIFAVLFMPWMKRISRGKFPNSLAAALFTFAVTLVLFIPIGTIGVVGAKSGLKRLQHFKQAQEAEHGSKAKPVTDPDDMIDSLIEKTGVKRAIDRAASIGGFDSSAAVEQVRDFLMTTANRVVDILGKMVAGLPAAAISFIVFLFAIFYFLADEEKILKIVRHYSMFSATDTERLIGVFTGLCKSVIVATVISGLAQAGIAGLACMVFGIGGALTVFALVFVCSFVPLIGSFPVMAFLTLTQLMGGHAGVGLAMVGVSVLVGTVDNFIRPYVISGGCDLHPLLGFTSALAGLELLGVNGVFVGPVLCGMGIEIIKIARGDSKRRAT